MHLKLLFVLFLFAYSIQSAKAQLHPTAPAIKIVTPITLDISTNTTSNIIFPFEITGVDRGSQDVLAQVAEGANNILQLKAATTDLKETNVTVTTRESGFYSFVIKYNSHPAVLNIQMQADSQLPSLNNSYTNGYEVYERLVLNQRKNVRIKNVNQNVVLHLHGVNLLNGKLWFALKIKNTSDIGYVIDQVDFTVSDNIRPRRTATQELDKAPVYQTEVFTIKGNRESLIALAFEPFTISSRKKLTILVTELNGERTLRIPVGARSLVRAKAIH